jgi:hypothetical protein
VRHHTGIRPAAGDHERDTQPAAEHCRIDAGPGEAPEQPVGVGLDLPPRLRSERAGELAAADHEAEIGPAQRGQTEQQVSRLDLRRVPEARLDPGDAERERGAVRIPGHQVHVPRVTRSSWARTPPARSQP